MVGRTDSHAEVLSLFCGAGGLDLGFEQAGFRVRAAYDRNDESIASYNHNRQHAPVGRVADVRNLSLDQLDADCGGACAPVGVIGGPPCQSFSKANNRFKADDPRHMLLQAFAKIVIELNKRRPLAFFAFENVPEMASARSRQWLTDPLCELKAAGFGIHQQVLLASNYGVPQKRPRLFIVGLNTSLISEDNWTWPRTITKSTPPNVRDAIGGLPEPVHFLRGLDSAQFPVHPNHWCMAPKSRKFTEPGALSPSRNGQRSFKTLSWNKPSLTVAFGNREVHIHPKCHRRLSVFEAMRLQGFPDNYVLVGTLSAQITQVSEAVPPPMARAVARRIRCALP